LWIQCEQSGKNLNLKLEQFMLRRTKEKILGQIGIHIRVVDYTNKTIFDQKRILLPNKNTVTLSIPFPWMQEGNYKIIVVVKELMTQKASMKYIPARTT